MKIKTKKMKTKLIIFLPILIVVFMACNSSEKKTEHEGHDSTPTTEQHPTTADDKEVKSVAITFSNIDAKVASSLKEVVNHYIHIKNALANDNADEAASGGRAMEKALKNIDKSLFTAEQKKIYDEDETELKEHAEHIGKKADDIKHQRDHFSLMSEVMYDIVKSFGGGQALYHDHCPMYNKDKGGAMWLSETKEVKNPYFGNEMPKCGTVEEIIK
jgi:hypothetical protein